MIVKAHKKKKYNKNIKYMHHWLQTLCKYSITTNDTFPASESFFIPEYRNVIRSGNNGSEGIQQMWQF